MFTNRRALGALALVGLFTTAPALAAPDLIVMPGDEPGTVTRAKEVKFHDLELGTASGRARLEQRITLAAREVCAYQNMHGMRQPDDYWRCFEKAKTDAMSKVPAQSASM